MLKSVTNQEPDKIELSLDKWCNANALFSIVAVSLSALSNLIVVYCFVALSSFIAFLLVHRSVLANYSPFGGLANWITLVRLLILVSVFLNMDSIPVFWILISTGTAVMLDVLDGVVARKFGQDSPLGQYFDMEVDAFYVMGMGLYFYLTTELGVWLLIPGLLRYFYRILVWIGPHQQYTEEKRKYAATLAGLNFALLLVAIIAPASLQTMILITTTCIVIGSFLISFIEYFGYEKNA